MVVLCHFVILDHIHCISFIDSYEHPESQCSVPVYLHRVRVYYAACLRWNKSLFSKRLGVITKIFQHCPKVFRFSRESFKVVAAVAEISLHQNVHLDFLVGWFRSPGILFHVFFCEKHFGQGPWNFFPNFLDYSVGIPAYHLICVFEPLNISCQGIKTFNFGLRKCGKWSCNFRTLFYWQKSKEVSTSKENWMSSELLIWTIKYRIVQNFAWEKNSKIEFVGFSKLAVVCVVVSRKKSHNLSLGILFNNSSSNIYSVQFPINP